MVLPVTLTILDDAQAVDPQIRDFELSTNLYRFSERLWEISKSYVVFMQSEILDLCLECRRVSPAMTQCSIVPRAAMSIDDSRVLVGMPDFDDSCG